MAPSFAASLGFFALSLRQSKKPHLIFFIGLSRKLLGLFFFVVCFSGVSFRGDVLRKKSTRPLDTSKVLAFLILLWITSSAMLGWWKMSLMRLEALGASEMLWAVCITASGYPHRRP